MALAAGTRLGPHDIISLIGVGGMGEVYKATDTRLNRTVAIKVLATRFSDNPEMKQRFEREAQTIAGLNHPHICTLFDVGCQDGVDYLVMEYLEGQTLAQRIERGPLPLAEVLKIAVEIADALDKAHRQGVVHRDAKPSNVMLTKGGTKLLDFGLAKLKPSERPASLSSLPTNAEVTVPGAILGTLQYMSPEQLEGKDADARTDIFAFGAMVYEMVTGRKAFEGKSQMSLIGAILERDPAPISTIQPAAPAALDRVIRRCLAKDPDNRWQSAADLTVQLEWLAGPTAEAAALSTAPSGVANAARAAKRWRTLAIVFLVTLLVLSAVFVRVYLSPVALEIVRFSVLPPEKGRFDSGVGSASGQNAGSISPDGRKLAFTARDVSGNVMLWVRALESLAAETLPGTDGAAYPFWSPDSLSIGFLADGKLKRIEANGGPVQTLSDKAFRSGAWSSDGTLLFSRTSQGPLYRVPAGGGEPTVATTLAQQQRTHHFPSFLPDDDHFIYQAIGSGEASGIFIGSLRGDPPRRLAAADSGAVYAAPGYLLFVRQGVLMAQPFALETLQLIGQATPIAESVGSVQGSPPFSVSRNQTLVYRAGAGAESMQMAWFDRSGKLIQTVGQPGGYISPSVAPNGRRLAVHRHDGSGGDIWLVDGETVSRLTFDASRDNSNPIWSPDGRMIAFGSLRNGKWGIYQKPANGTGDEQLLIESDLLSAPMSWSPDGKFLVYYISDPQTGADLWALPMSGANASPVGRRDQELSGDRKPSPIAQLPFDENHAQISPDGKWIAFNSTETGQRQIYVKPFPSGSGKWQASTTGGIFPRWRRDGRELFYMENADAGRMMAVGVRTDRDSIEFTPPRALFDSGFVNIPHPTNFQTYDVSSDGQRFLIPRPAGAMVTDPANDTPITIVLNWTAMLARK